MRFVNARPDGDAEPAMVAGHRLEDELLREDDDRVGEI